MQPRQPHPQCWGEPIVCPAGFSTFDAIARAEAHYDLEDDAELETNPTGVCPAATPAEDLTTENGQAGSLPPRGLTKNQKKNLKDRLARRDRRGLNAGSPKECSKKHRQSAKKHAMRVDTNTATDLPHSKPAWIGVRELEEDWTVYTLKELQETFGLQLIDWDGK